MILHWDDFGDAHGVDRRRRPRPAGSSTSGRRRRPAGCASSGTGSCSSSPTTRHARDDARRRSPPPRALAALPATPTRSRSSRPEKRAELVDLAKESELEARIAVCNHVNVLYVPQAESRLEPVELDVVTQASLKRNQTDAILERLAGDGEDARRRRQDARSRPTSRASSAPSSTAPFPTAELVEAFARRTDLKMVLDKAQLNALVAAGVRNGVWEYHDADARRRRLGDQGPPRRRVPARRRHLPLPGRISAPSRRRGRARSADRCIRRAVP